MTNPTLARTALAAAALAIVSPAQDAERATHADDAATPQLAFESKHDGLVVRQYQLGCLSQLTYLLVSDDAAVVVDPQRDVEHYRRDAKTLGASIRFAVLTHTNADFVAGHTELASGDGAAILISAESGSLFPHRAMQDGQRVAFGRASLEFWATPGHTLDSMTILVRDATSPSPLYALTGDALFVGSIGRPDLASGSIAPMALADRAFDSVQRFKTLPDATVVLPGHGAGSLCGAHLSPDTTTTIGTAKLSNPFFLVTSRAAFVARDISDLPPAPPYFAHNVAINKKGPPVVDAAPTLPPALAAPDVARAIADGAWLVDLRDAHDYAKAHLAGSINIALRGRLDTWTGMVVPFDAPLILVGSDDEAREAAFRFRRIGLDTVRGRFASSFDEARAAGLDVRTTALVAPAELAARIAAGTEPIVVDVRSASEHAELNLGEYANVDLVDWPRFGELLDRGRPVLFLCNSAYRSSMAVGLAERLGFHDLASLDGGLDKWLDAGLPVAGTASAGVNANAGTFALPEPIEPRALATGLHDQPSSWVVIDVRPAPQFDEYHVPQATNVRPQDVAAQVAKLPRRARIVLCDRDGTLAWAVAGAISATLRDAAPDLRVLSGGVSRYWLETTRAGGTTFATTAPSPSAVESAASPAAFPAAFPAVKPAPKKRSAGC